MFSLDGTMKYWLYNKPVDMRKSFDGLSGIVTDIYPEGMQGNPDYVEIGVETTDRQAFAIAPLPDMIIPKGMASESLLSDILINKFFYHLPFYRQIQKYKELGVVLNDATINDWFAAVCSNEKRHHSPAPKELASGDSPVTASDGQ